MKEKIKIFALQRPWILSRPDIELNVRVAFYEARQSGHDHVPADGWRNADAHRSSSAVMHWCNGVLKVSQSAQYISSPVYQPASFIRQLELTGGPVEDSRVQCAF